MNIKFFTFARNEVEEQHSDKSIMQNLPRFIAHYIYSWLMRMIWYWRENERSLQDNFKKK